MPIYKVNVEKRMFISGFIEVEADNEDLAIESVDDVIDNETLKMIDINWDDDQIYELGTFSTTGYVEEK